jgi:hypothetical protein
MHQAPWFLHLSLISPFPLIMTHLCPSGLENEVAAVTSRKCVVCGGGFNHTLSHGHGLIDVA